MKLFVIVILFGSFAIGSSIEMLVNGEATDRTKFCVGEMLTFVCDGLSQSFVWQIPPFVTGTDITVSTGISSITSDGFTGRYITMNESTLEFTARADINGSNITCLNLITNQVLASTIFKAYDSPEAPTIDIIPMADLSSFGIGIHSNDPSSFCVDHYNISLTADDLFLFVMIPRNDSVTYDASVIFNQTFELCTVMYNLSVVASVGGGVAVAALFSPAAPAIDITPNSDYTSFSIRISSDNPGSICVDQYNISLVSDDISLFAVVQKRDEVFDAKTIFNANLELCKLAYDLAVVASGGGDIASTTLNYASDEGCESLTNGNTQTTQEEIAPYKRRYEAALGAVIGITVVSAVIILLLSVVIATMGIKMKTLQLSKITVQPEGFKSIQVDEKKN